MASVENPISSVSLLPFLFPGKNEEISQTFIYHIILLGYELLFSSFAKNPNATYTFPRPSTVQQTGRIVRNAAERKTFPKNASNSATAKNS